MGLLEFGVSSSMKSMLDDVFTNAILADNLGFSRLWFGEHHKGTMWYNPEPFLPIVLASTDNIKVGIAGVLLSYHNPYRIALNFKLLSNLFPHRVDLGIAKGSVPLQIEQLMLAREETDKDIRFNQKFEQLINILSKNISKIQSATDFPQIPPINGLIPPLWYLGSSYSGIENALKFKINFSKSIFHKPTQNIFENCHYLEEFRYRFYDKYNEYPQINLAFSGACIKDFSVSSHNPELITNINTFNDVIGCPSMFYDTLLNLKEKFKINEFIFLNKLRNFSDKAKSMELLSAIFNLKNVK